MPSMIMLSKNMLDLLRNPCNSPSKAFGFYFIFILLQINLLTVFCGEGVFFKKYVDAYRHLLVTLRQLANHVRQPLSGLT